MAKSGSEAVRDLGGISADEFLELQRHGYFDQLAELVEQDEELAQLVREMPRGLRLCRHSSQFEWTTGEWWVSGLDRAQIDSYETPGEALKHVEVRA